MKMFNFVTITVQENVLFIFNKTLTILNILLGLYCDASSTGLVLETDATGHYIVTNENVAQFGSEVGDVSDIDEA